MSQPSSAGPASQAHIVRQEARSYLAQLRRERLQRLGKPEALAATDTLAKAPIAQTPVEQKDTPKIGKRGVRVKANAPSATRVTDGDKTMQPQRRAALEARSNAREALRNGAAKARQAAHDAQQKMRDARLKQRQAALQQRQAAAKQRENVKAMQSRSAQGRGARAALLAAEPAPQKRRAPRKVASKALPPLTEIKGIGDAMTRRLEQAGIHTLVDLAHTSPDAIRERLGPVSTLANVEAWQEQASSLLP